MLRKYLEAAMRHGQFKILDDGTFFGNIPELQGVWANSENLAACREELEEVLEDWLLISLRKNLPVPEIDGIELSIKTLAS